LASVHADNCYDRIAHPMASMAFQSFGVPTKAIKLVHSTIQNMKFFLRMGFGNSVGYAGGEATDERASHERLAAGTVKDTMQYVCTTFWENGYSNPSIDDGGQPAFILKREFRSFKNTDPEENHQKAIPFSVISELIHRDSTKLERATGKLATVGIFFAVPSCKYLKVAKPKQQRTKILRLRNVRFFQGVEQLYRHHRVS
jgi:hypothetical protein